MATASPVLERAEPTRHRRLRSALGERGRLLDTQLAGLVHEFDASVQHDRIVEICDDVLERLLDHASFTNFVPILTYRYAREQLILETTDAA